MSANIVNWLRAREFARFQFALAAHQPYGPWHLAFPLGDPQHDNYSKHICDQPTLAANTPDHFNVGDYVHSLTS